MGLKECQVATEVVGQRANWPTPSGLDSARSGKVPGIQQSILAQLFIAG